MCAYSIAYGRPMHLPHDLSLGDSCSLISIGLFVCTVLIH